MSCPPLILLRSIRVIICISVGHVQADRTHGLSGAQLVTVSSAVKEVVLNVILATIVVFTGSWLFPILCTLSMLLVQLLEHTPSLLVPEELDHFLIRAPPLKHSMDSAKVKEHSAPRVLE
ncbi:hypothetical protein FOMPIDRAFT_92394 [Fomitopsis schrenkii]|uniref:Uncharacterized protein n=1 Tax=Fomitopsis schrenkii TaxID=2126942 RepID=S8DRU1_FOMSC|nr:hypothetical protein FOMPIDRAFT_92394 [Fomitopsis schrenkii]